MGEEALERKLIDAIGGLDEAIEEARALAHVPADEAIEIREVRRARPWLLERVAEMAARDAFGGLLAPGAGIEMRADVDVDE